MYDTSAAAWLKTSHPWEEFESLSRAMLWFHMDAHDVTDVEIIQREDSKRSAINKLVNSDTVSSSTCIRVCRRDKFNLTPGSQREFIWMKSDMSHLLQTTVFNGPWLKG